MSGDSSPSHGDLAMAFDFACTSTPSQNSAPETTPSGWPSAPFDQSPRSKAPRTSTSHCSRCRRSCASPNPTLRTSASPSSGASASSMRPSASSSNTQACTRVASWSTCGAVFILKGFHSVSKPTAE
eukprot:Amastigsp_a844163_8.p4 type:complete len:127 gc:universal Amastigsp_a844163_8:999-619(-)